MDTKISIQQKACQALSEINKLDGEDNLFQYILCLLKYSILPAYCIKHKDLKTRLMKHLASHSEYELVNKEEWKDVQFLLFKTFLELQKFKGDD